MPADVAAAAAGLNVFCCSEGEMELMGIITERRFVAAVEEEEEGDSGGIPGSWWSGTCHVLRSGGD